MSNTITLINKLDASSDASVAELSNIILNDHALISKILKLVNSVNYVEFGEVTTISRAIVLLGFESIKNLAMTLLLFEHFKKNASEDIIDAIVKSVYSGTLARKISIDWWPEINGEEAFICALFHTLGKMIAASYLPDEYHALYHLINTEGISEAAASAATLGMSFEELGITIAREWNFPARIICSMKKIRPSRANPMHGEIDTLCAIANFSNEVSNIISSGRDTDTKLAELLSLYQVQFGHLGNTFSDLLSATFQDITAYAHVFNISLAAVPFSKQLIAWSRGEILQPQPSCLLGIENQTIKTIETIAGAEQALSPEMIFINGIQEMNNSLIQNHPLNDILRIALETAYRALSFFSKTKTLFFIKDTKQPIMTVRFGFGSDIDETMQWFRIPLNEENNFFHLAISKQADLVIKDLDAPDIATMVPTWYRSQIKNGLYVIILPIVVNAKPIGFFYAEGERATLDKISVGQLKYLTILRDITVLAIKQRQG